MSSRTGTGSFDNSHFPRSEGTFHVDTPENVPISRWIEAKQDVIEALKKKSEELDAGLSTSRSYKVEAAAYDWLEHGLPGRSERTRELHRDALAPLLEKIGKRQLRDLTAGRSRQV